MTERAAAPPPPAAEPTTEATRGGSDLYCDEPTPEEARLIANSKQPAGALEDPVAGPDGEKLPGFLTRDQITEVVLAHRDQIRACNPGLVPGDMVVQWQVDLAGNVSSACVMPKTTLPAVEVLTCIRDRVRSWAFDRPDGGEVRVSFPFVFKAPPAAQSD